MGKRKSSPRLATTSFIDAVTRSLDRNVNMYTRFSRSLFERMLYDKIGIVLYITAQPMRNIKVFRKSGVNNESDFRFKKRTSLKGGAGHINKADDG